MDNELDESYVDFIEEYSSSFDGSIPTEDVIGIAEMLDGELDSGIDSLEPEDVDIKEHSDGSYRIEVDGYVVNYSPEDQRDANDQISVGDEPPEVGGLR